MEHQQDHTSRTSPRVLVVGSPDFPLRTTIAELLLSWWVGNGKPFTTLVVEQGVVGALAIDAWDRQSFPVEQHPAPPEVPLRSDRRRREAMLPGVVHAFVLEAGPLDMMGWVGTLTEHEIPFTRVTLRTTA